MLSTRIAVSAASTAALLLTAACGASGGAGHGSAPTSGAGRGASAAAVNAGGPAGGGAQADLCRVLTVTQVQQALGVPVGPGTKAESPGVGCGWIDSAPGNNSTADLLYVDPTIYDGVKQANGVNGMKLVKADGIGDEAFFEILSPNTVPLLLVKKGSAIVSVSADVRANGSGDTDPAKDEAAEKQLGAIVASAL